MVAFCVKLINPLNQIFCSANESGPMFKILPEITDYAPVKRLREAGRV